MLHCGIIGLPLSGKSTVFNVITRAGAEVKPYAGGKTDPNKAVVPVPDKRFDALVEIRGGAATSEISGFDTLANAENLANFP